MLLALVVGGASLLLIGHVFHTGWDAEIIRFETAYLASSEYGSRAPSRAGLTINSREIVKDLPHAAVAGDMHRFWEKFVVPPNTKVERWKPNGIGVVLEMSNPFVALSVTIDRDAWGIGCGSLALLAGMGRDESEERTFTVSYRVRLRATFQRLRSGHPDMPIHERWVSTLFGQLRLLDAEQRWRMIKQDYAFQRDQDAWFQEQLARAARDAKDAGKRTAGQ
jgi:hypothetical protein